MTNSGFKTAFAAMAGLGALIGGSGSASAALVQTFSLDHHAASNSQTLTFDTATPNVSGHGALTQVSIALSTAAAGGSLQASLTGGEGTASRGPLTADLSIIDGSGSVFSGSASVAASSCAVGSCFGPGPTRFPVTSSFSPGSSIVLTDSVSLTAFATSPVQLTAEITNYTLTGPSCVQGSHSVAPTCSGFDNITWAPTISVSYTYAKVSDLPEPGTIGLLGLGGIALVRMRRRRSRGRAHAPGTLCLPAT